MPAGANLSSDASRYVAVATEIERRIAAGTLKTGSRLAGEHALAKTFAVSRVTIRTALRLLERKGLVERRAGAGTFVAVPQRLSHDVAILENLFGRFAKQGVRTETKVLGFAAVDDGVRLSRLWHVKGAAFAVTESWLHRDVANVSRADIEVQPGYAVLERLGHHITRADVKLRADRAGKSVGRMLGIKASDPILILERTTYSEDDEALEHTTCFVRSDKIEFVLATHMAAAPAHSLQAR